MRLEKRAHQEPDPRGLPEPRATSGTARTACRPRPSATSTSTMSQLTLPEAALLAGLHPVAGGARTRSSTRARRPGGAATCSTRWSQTHKITAGAGRRGEVGAAADHDLLPALVAARLLHGRGDRTSCSSRSPNDPGDPADVLGCDEHERLRQRCATAAGCRSTRTTTRPCSTSRQLGDHRRHPDEPGPVHGVARRRSTTPTAACARSRSAAASTQSQFDPAVDGPGRQAGSSFKMFTLATALSNGLLARRPVSTATAALASSGPATTTTTCPATATAATPRSPRRSRSPTTARSCARSCRSGPGNFGADGVNRSSTWRRAMGIDTSNFQPVVSTTLGTHGVHPLEMAQAYSVLANDGILQPRDVRHRRSSPRTARSSTRRRRAAGAGPRPRTSPAPRRRC